jgi:hypothetical protein
MSSSASLIMTLVGFASTLVIASLEVALLVVILTTVRRHRPDAYSLLAIGTGLDLVFTVLGTISAFATSIFGIRGEGGIETYAQMYAATTAFFMLAHAAARVTFIVGLVRLARPTADPMRDPGRYE